MRIPADFGRRRREPRPQRGRIGLLVFVALAFVAVTSLRGIAIFYTDYLWFGEIGMTDVWRGVLGAKIILAVGFTALFFAALWVNLVIADRIAPRVRLPGRDDELVQRYRETVGRHTGKVRVGVALLFALMTGTGASAQWHNWMLFRNAVEFGVDEPQFGRDVGFYVFTLPFISFLVNWAFVSLVVIAAVALAAHYLNGGIRLQAIGQRVTPQVKAHLSVLLGLMAIVKAVGYFFQRYELTLSTRGAVHGATYTDVKAQLPAINLLIFISIAAAILFLINIRRQGWVLPGIAVGLWAFISIVVGALYPAFIQQVRVQPAENTKEQPYIVRNIAATRSALGLDRVNERQFNYGEDLTAADLAKNSQTIRNVRLWDPRFVQQTYQRLQEIRSYYRFNDVDIDRYVVDGQLTQTLIAARELNPDELPRRSWVNRHLQFTHGFGAIVAPANAVARGGQPEFFLRDIPPRGRPALRQPRIYYGENAAGFAIVRTKQREIDYIRAEGGDETSTYAGRGGVQISSPLRRFALFLRFGDPNTLISSNVTPSSRAIYLRNIGDRVRAAAPFLRYDADPYPVIVDGRMLWVQDAYTTTSRYPNAQRASTDRVPNASGLRTPFNYVRNSVKVVIDAYHGSMDFYLFDEDDAIARTYAKAFPGLFTPASEMDDELRAHLRYPEDLFRVQTNMYGRYHITDPLEFYNAGDAWNISQDPGSGEVGSQVRTVTTVEGFTVKTTEQRMDPAYLVMRLPGDEREGFMLLQPFVPVSESDRQRNLTAFMVAKSDPAEYGELEAFIMPRGRQIDGPAIVDARISAAPEISQTVTQLNQQGSRVLMGNVLVIPIEESLLYVRPLYVTSSTNRLPELKKVIVVYANRAVMRDTMQQALAELFGDAPDTREETGTAPTPAEPTDVSTAALLQQAEARFKEADDALKRGDLGEYQKKNREGAELVRQAREREQRATTSTTTTTAAAA